MQATRAPEIDSEDEEDHEGMFTKIDANLTEEKFNQIFATTFPKFKLDCLSARWIEGGNALLKAIFHNNLKLAGYFVGLNPALVNLTSAYGSTPLLGFLSMHEIRNRHLSSAPLTQDQLNFVQLLLKSGADANHCNRISPLIATCSINDVAATKLLLRYGAKRKYFFYEFEKKQDRKRRVYSRTGNYL